MKISIFVILSCLLITLQYQYVTGGLVKDFFGKVHETAGSVREDIRNVLHLNNNKKGSDNNKENGNKEGKDEASPNESDNKTTEKVTEPTTAANVVTTSTGTTTTAPETTTSIVTTTAAIDTNTTVTEKDERENFKAPCVTGYQRTADGRCKPTF